MYEKFEMYEYLKKYSIITPKIYLLSVVTLLDENGNYVGTKIVEDGGTIQDMPEGYRQADFTNVHGSKTIYAIPEEQRNAKRFSPPNTSDTSIVMWGSIFEIALLSIMINGYILKKYARN